MSPHPPRALLISLLTLCSIAAADRVAAEQDQPNARTVIRRAPATECALLDDALNRSMMDGLLFATAWSSTTP